MDTAQQRAKLLNSRVMDFSLFGLPVQTQNMYRVLLMLALSILSHRLGIEHGLAIALFPMVILAMTIERMSIIWEEHGAGDAIRQGIGSLMVAVASYLLMINPYIEHLIFVFPELLLIVLATTLLLGRYTGYRLSELLRFRVLAGRAKS